MKILYKFFQNPYHIQSAIGKKLRFILLCLMTHRIRQFFLGQKEII